MVGGNDYVIQVKGNQSGLKKAIKHYVSQNDCDSQYTKKEKNKGREEKRQTYVYWNIEGEEFKKWKGLTTIIVVRRSGKRKNEPYDTVNYFISSRKQTSAKVYAKGIRRHWWIENKLHWVKDVILHEDKSLVKDKDVAENLSLLRIIIMNLYRIKNCKSIKYAIERFTNRLDECNYLIYE